MIMAYPKIDFLYLNEEDMVKAGVKDMASCVEDRKLSNGWC